MLHKETVETGILDLIKQLITDHKLRDFFMVGGTALSLLIGHRISVDIDLFTQKDFDAVSLKQYLEQDYKMTDAKAIKNGVFGFINNIKIDLLAHQYPLIKPLQEIEGIRMLSLEDIGAMKLHAIVNSGNRYKDFIDIFLLLEHRPLMVLAKAYENKYPNVNIQMAKNALVYFKDIDNSVPVKLIKEPVKRKVLEDRLRNAIVNTLSIYAPYDSKKQRKSQGKNLGL